MLIEVKDRADSVQIGENEGRMPGGHHRHLGAEMNIRGHMGAGKAQRTRLKCNFPLGTGKASDPASLCGFFNIIREKYMQVCGLKPPIEK